MNSCAPSPPPPHHARAGPCRGFGPDGGFGAAQLRVGDSAFRQTRVAQADLDFSNPVVPDARANGEREGAEDELKMGDLEPLGGERNLAMGGQSGRLQQGAERFARLGGGKDKNGSVNAEHDDLFIERVGSDRPGRKRRRGLTEKVEDICAQRLMSL
jgi:hypothetical protein